MIDGVPIMKGSTLTFTIVDGEFDEQFFDPDRFEPMIEIIRKSRQQINQVEFSETVEEKEHTKVIKKPDCMSPEWREVLTFDIMRPSDEISIQIINQYQNEKEILAEKPFVLQEVGHDENDPLHELKEQKRIEDILLISNQEGDTIGQIKYQATWIYNKREFLMNLLKTMNDERDDLIREIRNQDKKLQLIAKPFGAYINIIDIDDIHFEDKFLSNTMKQKLAVREFEKAFSVKFNMVAAKMGLRDTQWGRLAIIMFSLWCLCTCFVCFQKPDFLNVSVYLPFPIVTNNFILMIIVDARSCGPIPASGSSEHKAIIPSTTDICNACYFHIRYTLDIRKTHRILVRYRRRWYTIDHTNDGIFLHAF